MSLLLRSILVFLLLPLASCDNSVEFEGQDGPILKVFQKNNDDVKFPIFKKNSI